MSSQRDSLKLGLVEILSAMVIGICGAGYLAIALIATGSFSLNSLLGSQGVLLLIIADALRPMKTKRISFSIRLHTAHLLLIACMLIGAWLRFPFD